MAYIAVALAAFERAMEHRDDVGLLARIDRPCTWVAHVACATERVRAGLRDAWGLTLLASFRVA